MDVRFYDSDFKLLHIEPLFESVSWNILYNGIGTFEMHMAPDSPLLEIALENRYLIAVQGDRQAVVTTKHFEDEKPVLYGRTLNFLLDKRVCFPFDGAGEDAVTKVCELIEEIPGVVFESDADSAGECNYCTDKPASLLQTLCGILEEKGLGHSYGYDFERKQWVFRIIRGRENNLLLSESLLNMYAFEKTESILDFANCGYYYQKSSYLGNWDAVANSPCLTEDESNVGKIYQVSNGGTRFGITWNAGDFIICCSADGKFTKSATLSEGFYVFVGEDKSGAEHLECFLDDDNLEDARKSLGKQKAYTSVVAKVKNVEFGRDYLLGDVVRLSKKNGDKVITEKKRITEINIWQENANEGEMPVFSEYKEEE